MVKSEMYFREIPQKNAAGLRHPADMVAVVGATTDGVAITVIVRVEISAAMNYICKKTNKVTIEHILFT
jgi:hypothetical protein